MLVSSPLYLKFVASSVALFTNPVHLSSACPTMTHSTVLTRTVEVVQTFRVLMGVPSLNSIFAQVPVVHFC